MANKSFSILNNDEPEVEQGDRLIIEIGKSHMALLHAKPESPAIVGFELFSFDEKELLEPNVLLNEIYADSGLMKLSLSATDIFINNACCMPVPEAKYSDAAAVDYADLIFGQATGEQIFHETPDIQPPTVLMYRLPDVLMQALSERFQNLTLHHTWTRILNALNSKGLFSSIQFMHAQFYETSFVLVVISNRMLHFIQHFAYDTPEDVLYYLLNVAERFKIDKDNIELSISGLVDPNYKLFRELNNYFKNIVADKVDLGNVAINISDHPRHYFTPFFNLAS